MIIYIYIYIYALFFSYYYIYVPSDSFPLSYMWVCVYIFLEVLESGPFKYRLPSNTTYFIYIDDILISQPTNIKIEKIAEKLNNVEVFINFTYEKESFNTIPSLDILIIKFHYDFTFKVYRKLTNKNNTFLLPPQQQNQNRPHYRLLTKSTQNM